MFDNHPFINLYLVMTPTGWNMQCFT